MRFLLYFLLTALGIWAVSTYLWNIIGISITGENRFVSALIFAVILSIVNAIIGTILRILTFPINFITFGVFSGIITIFLIWITDKSYNNIDINNILGYICIAIIPIISKNLLKK